MLRLVDVSMYYQNGTNVTVGIKKVNLEFRVGEFVAITGESGSGKTTLLNVISSLSSFHEGELYIDGKPTSGYDDAEWENYRREHIGFIFQNYDLIDSYTVLQNVVSAMIVKGRCYREAKAEAMNYLKQVGLERLAYRRASKLSSGQKQRLAIARALAKDTDIIVADEPTGNLDSENGRQVVEILAELAKTKLVIMVSHNIEEAEKYASRLIRMQDGQVVSNTVLYENPPVEKKTEKKQRQISELKLASVFAGLNRHSQRVKSTIAVLFIAVVCCAAFVFLGSILYNRDDTPARVYDNTAFLNGDPLRVVIRRTDGEIMGESDFDYFESLEHCMSVEKDDALSDCSYYYRDGEDYKVKYSVVQSPAEAEAGIPPKKYENVLLLKNDNYIKTTYSLTEDALLAGRLPQNSGEVVLYSKDESVLGTQIQFYFSDTRHWSTGSFLEKKMTVVGLLSDKREQVRFHPDIAYLFSGEYIEKSCIANLQKNDVALYTVCSASGAVTIICDETLASGTVIIPKDFYEAVSDGYGEIAEDVKLVVSYAKYDGYESTVTGDTEITSSNLINTETTFSKILKGTSTYGTNLFVSKNDYYKIFHKYPDYSGTQATVYIDDYAYVVDFLEACKASGEYEAISPYRLGAIEFDETLVKERLIALIVSIVAFIAAFGLEIVILFNILRLRKDDYRILHSLGLKTPSMKRISFIEFPQYNILGMLIAALAITAAWYFKLPLLDNYLKYYRPIHIVVVFAASCIANLILVMVFNNYLVKQVSRRGNK